MWQRQLATLEHFLLRNLAEILGEPLVKRLDFRPVRKDAPPRRRPQRADAARPSQERVNDPVLDLVYRQLKKKA